MTDLPDPRLLKLIQMLCLEAGRLMEDRSPEFALVLPKEPSELAARLEYLREVSEELVTLSAAAQALYRRALEPGSRGRIWR
jgi:hypothetical protein